MEHIENIFVANFFTRNSVHETNFQTVEKIIIICPHNILIHENLFKFNTRPCNLKPN